MTDTQVGGSQVCENEGKNSKIKQFSAQEQKRREGPLVESQGCLEEAPITTGWKNTVSGGKMWARQIPQRSFGLFALASYQLHYCCLFEFGHLML